MYCTNCGRKLPEDGSPCICGAQNGNFNTQPTQNFQTPPQHYAQPPVQYPVQRPVLPVTPVHGVLKSFFASPLFLITAILFSVNLLFQIIASLFPQDPAYIVNQIYSNLPYEMQFIISPGDLYSALSDAQSGTTIGTVIGMLITGGLMAAGSLRKGGDLWRSDYCLLRCTVACPGRTETGWRVIPSATSGSCWRRISKIILSW